MKVLFVASEGVPFSKTGGLADVVGSLSQKLTENSLDVRVFLPKYKGTADKFGSNLNPKFNFAIDIGWREKYCGIDETYYRDVPFYFIDNEYYFGRTQPYGYDDDGERFAFYCRAVLASLPVIDFCPDIIHLHDWQTGMISLLLKDHYGENEFYDNIKTVFTIHNLKYQGVFNKDILPDLLGLSWDYFHPGGVEFYDQVNCLKAGIVYSDKLTTVSPTYSLEIQNPFFGENLDGLLRERQQDLIGIINGIDYQIYDPKTDEHIFKNYASETLSVRRENKLAVQEKLELPVDEHIPMIVMISRLVSQKGLELIECVLDDILNRDIQFVILGSGEKHYEDLFIAKAEQYPDKLFANICFSDELAHQLYASADFILMPSLFEPCGLSQLIACRYGCIPIVRETGGLKDTIQSYDAESGTGNGFSFTNYNAHDMLYTIDRALFYFKENNQLEKIRNNAISSDFSWSRSAKKYYQLYESLI